METSDRVQGVHAWIREATILVRDEAVVLGLPTCFGNVAQIFDCFVFLTPQSKVAGSVRAVARTFLIPHCSRVMPASFHSLTRQVQTINHVLLP